MSPEENMIIVRRALEELFANRNFEAAAQFYDENYVHRGPGTRVIRGIQSVTESAPLFEIFPDLKFIIEDIFAVEDKVVFRWTIRGTHSAEFMGFPATGKLIHWQGINIVRLVDSKVAEDWVEHDGVGLMQQLQGQSFPEASES